MTSHQIQFGKTTENTQVAIISFSANSIVFVICLKQIYSKFRNFICSFKAIF